MEKVTANAKIDGDERAVSVEFDFGSDLDAAVEAFGEVVVFNNFVASAKVSLQGYIRALGASVDDDGEQVNDDTAIQAKVDAWKVPDKTGRKADKGAKIAALMESLSPEDREAILAQLNEG